MLSADKYQLEVFFLDYGDTEWVPKNMVQPVDPSLLKVSHRVIGRNIQLYCFDDEKCEL